TKVESKPQTANHTVVGDLSEQIKAATQETHVRAENTDLMTSFQKGQITRTQYKVLLCSLYEIYTALEEALDRNSSHPAVAPIYFPQELDRTEALERDLEFFLGSQWRSKVIVPAATHRYAQRLREIGKVKPELLVAHAYTRYLGDLSGGQVLGKLAQKAMELEGKDGLAFFSFPGVSSANRFKQLYRSRMNSIELSEEQRREVLQEAVDAFNFNIQVFDDLQKMLSVTSESAEKPKGTSRSTPFPPPSSVQLTVGLCVGLLTVGIGLYNF
uniref:Heme oxygenase n=1 Tax=Periophthalmus magnuspinnatus TaxID=409849 RepID=A0A3B4B182_9GOBI